MLTNLQPTAQQVLVRFYPEGEATIAMPVTLQPHQRYSLGVHSDVFPGRAMTYSVIVEWPMRGLTQLVMRSFRTMWNAPPAMPAPQEWCVESSS